MKKLILLSSTILLVSCAPGATLTSAGSSFDRVQVGQEWVIEYTLNGQSERGTFIITRDARPHDFTCGSGCGDLESVASMGARVTEAASGTGEVWLWNYKSGKRDTSFVARRLGRFDDVTCYVALGVAAETFKANITPNGVTKSESGSCRVLNVR